MAEFPRWLGAVAALLLALCSVYVAFLLTVGDAFLSMLGGRQPSPWGFGELAFSLCFLLLTASVIAMVSGRRAPSIVVGALVLPYWIYLPELVRLWWSDAMTTHNYVAWEGVVLPGLLIVATGLVVAGNVVRDRPRRARRFDAIVPAAPKAPGV